MNRFVRHLTIAVALTPLLLSCSEPAAPDAGPITVLGCEQGTLYVIGRSLSGVLEERDCRDFSGALTDYYQFSFSRAGPASIVVTSDTASIPLILLLMDQDLEDISFVDMDYLPPGESRTVGGEFRKGTYTLAVSAYEAGPPSRYTMTSSATLPPVPHDRRARSTDSAAAGREAVP